MNPTCRMPAEWEPQAAIWLAWPHYRDDWPGKFALIPSVCAEIVRLIAAGQQVRLIVRDEKHEAAARKLLERAHADAANIDYYRIPTNRFWLRDSGPIFVYDAKGKKTLLDWRFDGWGKRYRNHALDNAVPQAVNAHLKLPRIEPVYKGKKVVMEGGAIDVNGKGMLLTTEECLLSDIQCRNPGFSREDYEQVFAEYFGIRQVIWLGDGIIGDETTHGHVDDLARFVGENVVAIATERDKRDDNYALLQANLKRLKAARNLKGKPLDIVELPMPKALWCEGQRLPASYANFLITNKLVLVPTFNDPADRLALNALAECFPKREIIGIHAVDLVWGLGTMHCMSQQEIA